MTLWHTADEALRPMRKPRGRPKRTDVAQSEGSDAVLVGEHEEEKDEKQVDEKKDEGSDATPPPAKKARLLEGLRIDARSVPRITGMRCTEVIWDEDLIESMELQWIEFARALGTCVLCGRSVDESGGCMWCQIVRLPEANEASEAASEAAVEAVVEVAEDRHAC